MATSDSVWARTETSDPIVSDRVYNATIGGVLLWGFFVNYMTVTNVPVETILAIPWWMLLVGYFLSVLVGTMMYQSSDKPAISFLGYNFIVVPVGIVLTPFLYGIDPNIIGKAMILTGGFTGIMMTLGIMYPSFFLSLGRVLFFSLLLMIGVQFAMAFFFHLESGVIDWIIALIFCGYIGYDWARANKIPKTLDNAVDSAASLYLDIINLFIRIIRILGRR